MPILFLQAHTTHTPSKLSIIPRSTFKMAAPDADPSSEHRKDALRQQREDSNKNSPFLNLPGELRNEIYGLALPHDQVFHTANSETATKVNRIEKDGQHHTCKPIQKSEAYQRQFGLTQVSRQIRKETVKLAYNSNIFLLRVHRGQTSFATERNAAERWIASRAPEASGALSRIILQYWDSSFYFTYMDMTLFETSLKDFKVISEANIGPCDELDHYWHSSYGGDKRECERCYEDHGRLRDFKCVLDVTNEATNKADGRKMKPAEKMLTLISSFRGAFKQEVVLHDQLYER